MKILKIKFFIIGLIALCSLNACIEVDKTLGLDYVPDSQLLQVNIREFTVPIYTAATDSICTSRESVRSIGYMINEPFGLFYAGAVFRMVPYTNSFTYPEGAILDSAILHIPIANKVIAGDEGKMQQTLYLHQLNRDLQSDKDIYYYNNSLKIPDYNSMAIGDPYEYRGEDTIKIRLGTVYAQALMNATEEEMSNDTLFLQTFKGLYLAADTLALPSGLQGGRIAYFNNAWITTYYHKSVEDDTAHYYLYYINPDLANFNVYKHSSVHLANDQPTANIYIEGLAGVKPYIDFNDVKVKIQAMLDSLGSEPSKLLINRLELITQIDYPTYNMDNFPVMTTFAYKDTSAFLYSFLIDTYLSQFDGLLNRSLRQYSYNPTYFSQGLFIPHSQDKDIRHLYIYPLYSYYDYYGQRIYDLERTYYSFGVLKGPNAKIKLSYTLLP
ncbi:MAG: DUF4270 domain-containing protein [Prevotellaceae bacterium]|jgi:hypothetical protein|nr:DUF4270 domain-containing protein [Prevotellaceae bacterium]